MAVFHQISNEIFDDDWGEIFGIFLDVRIPVESYFTNANEIKNIVYSALRLCKLNGRLI
jgi:hypothetical protein